MRKQCTLQGRRRLYLCARHPRRLRLSAVEHQQDHQQGDLSRHLRERYEGNQCAEREVWLLPSLRQREGRLFQELHRADLSDFRRCGPLSQCRREGRHATLSRHQEPFLQ